MWPDFTLFLWVTVKVSLLGAFCALDRTALLQMMFSRPLVAATFAGALVGNWEVGLLLGASLELYFMSEIPVGTIIPTDDTLLALAAGGAAAALHSLPQNAGKSPGTLALLVLMLVLLWAPFTRKLDSWVRHRNGELVDEVETALLAASSANGPRLPALNLHLRGIFNFYGAAVFGLILMVMSLLIVTPLLFCLVPEWIYPLTDRLLIVFPIIGIVGLLSNMNQKRQLAVFAGMAFLLFFL